MPAASYREGPDGHSSRKQNSKRRRAKCSPSFVSGRVIGHGDIPPRCVPECSAMALHRAVPAARPSRASTLSFVLLAGRSPSPAFGAVFFAGRAAVIWCGANPGVRPWQDLHEYVLGRLAVAIFRHGAFPGGNPWQVLRSMYPERGLGRENRPFPARFARHVSEKPRKPPSEDTPREYPARKGPFSLHGPLESCIVRRSCHPASTKRLSARNPCAADQRQTARAPATPAPPSSASRQS